MGVIKVSIIGIVGMILSVVIKKTQGEYSVLIGLATTTLIFYFIISKLGFMIQDILSLMDISGINRSYIQILLKMTGITYITEIASGICKDGGHQAIATQIEIFGRISILGIGMGLITNLLNMVLEHI